MKFYLISDNIDTQMGMRLAGIEGVVVHTREEVEESLDRLMKDDSIGIILMTQKLLELSSERVYNIKLNYRRPLIVEIPDRHGSGNIGDAIGRYVGEAIGVKL